MVILTSVADHCQSSSSENRVVADRDPDPRPVDARHLQEVRERLQAMGQIDCVDVTSNNLSVK